MKKVIALILLSVIVLSFAACGEKNDTAKETQAQSTLATEAPTEEAREVWYQIPDRDVLGIYQRVDDNKDTGYYIFTSENTVRYRNGCRTLEFDIEYGLSAEGNRIGRSDGPVLFGNWTYGFEDGCLLVVYENGEQFKYSPVRYTPVELKPFDTFEKNDELIGKWQCVEDETIIYEFTEDGYCNYSYEIKASEEQNYNYKATTQFIYDPGYYTVYLETYVSDTQIDGVDVSYSVSGDNLTLDSIEYVRVTE